LLGEEVFLFSTMSRWALRSTQTPVEWVLGLSLGGRGREWLGMKLTIYFHLVLRLRMSGTILALPLYAFMASYNIFK